MLANLNYVTSTLNVCKISFKEIGGLKGIKYGSSDLNSIIYFFGD